MPHRGGDAAEGRRAVSVEMKDVRALAIHQLQERGERHRVELRTLEIRDVDAEGLERLFRQIASSQAEQLHGEACRIEARDHPAEESLDPMHARSLPAEVIADLQDVERPLAHVAITDINANNAWKRAIISKPPAQPPRRTASFTHSQDLYASVDG